MVLYVVLTAGVFSENLRRFVFNPSNQFVFLFYIVVVNYFFFYIIFGDVMGSLRHVLSLHRTKEIFRSVPIRSRVFRSVPTLD